jgi:hypothetical protein
MPPASESLADHLADHLVAQLIAHWPDAKAHEQGLRELLRPAIAATEQDVYTYGDGLPAFRLVHEGAWDLMEAWSLGDALSAGPRPDDVIVTAPAAPSMKAGRWRLRRGE